MWTFYRDKYISICAAIEGQYPEALQDPMVAVLIAQIRGLEASLDKIMTEKEEERCHCGDPATDTYDGDQYCAACKAYSQKRDADEDEFFGAFPDA